MDNIVYVYICKLKNSHRKLYHYMLKYKCLFLIYFKNIIFKVLKYNINCKCSKTINY